MRPFVAAGLLVFGAVGGAAVTYWAVTSRPPAPAPPAAPTARTADGRTVRDFRPALREIIRNEVEPLRRNGEEAALDAFLAELERRAVEKQTVSALEMEPGFEAVDALQGQVDAARLEMKRARFLARMERLSHALSGRSDAGEEATVTQEAVLEQLDGVAAADTQTERDEQVTAYIRAATQLPGDQYEQAMARLDHVLAASAPPSVQPSAYDLAERVRAAPESERDAVLLEVQIQAAELSEEEQEQLRRLLMAR